ncbi:hypothetical protein An03g01260 [Aspergillus niger]|uniref:Uncharacterized protein n=2 Tax=Aspergillus niger TaxID=5061 RepID=A2QFY9_ASPNC|nr:hypothetical protein An03g01260 [Aspergillus niger]CAK38099.1 hypothetical protein An03g01260 [Aspergillus niger]
MTNNSRYSRLENPNSGVRKELDPGEGNALRLSDPEGTDRSMYDDHIDQANVALLASELTIDCVCYRSERISLAKLEVV